MGDLARVHTGWRATRLPCFDRDLPVRTRAHGIRIRAKRCDLVGRHPSKSNLHCRGFAGAVTDTSGEGLVQRPAEEDPRLRGGREPLALGECVPAPGEYPSQIQMKAINMRGGV